MTPPSSTGPALRSIHIPERHGVGFRLERGQLLRIIDPVGSQVADLVAFTAGQRLSAGRTVDYCGTLFPTVGDRLYSDRSNPMLSIEADTVGRHAFIYEPCSAEMFEIQYGLSDEPNCLDNLATAVEPYGVEPSRIATPFNVFLNVAVDRDGRLAIEAPRSRPGDSVTLRAEMDLVVGVTACASYACNGGMPTPIDLELFAAATG